MLYVSIGKNLLDKNYSIQFNDGESNLGHSYPYPRDFAPYPAVMIPVEHLKEYRDFIDNIIKKHEETKCS